MWTLPNIITLVRICFTPVIALLPFIEGYWPKLIAFIIFIIAAVSDIYDGHLARSRNEVTDLGKLLDPIADKLLLFATLIPIYFISRQRHDLYDIPIWGSIPLWVCLLLIGRELAMTVFRWWASRRGVVIPAAGAGKLKTTIQNIFVGAIILWFAFRDARKPMGWEHNRYAQYWNEFHGGFVAVTLAVAAAAHRLLLCALSLPQSATLLRTQLGASSRPSMNIELVTIGTELLLGFTVDTNGAEIARRLADHGVRVVRRISVADQPDAIRAAVAEALQRTGAVLTTGGLGPTRDDMTKKVVAELFQAPLEFDESVWASLLARFARLERKPAESNRSQAEVPRGATVLRNRWGTAPGLWLEGSPGLTIMLPGVPQEMRKLLEHEVVPRLAGKSLGSHHSFPPASDQWNARVHPGRAPGRR